MILPSRLFALLVLMLAGLLWHPGEAAAQPAVCNQIRADIAQLRGARGPTAASNRLRRELGRVQGLLAANECHRSGFLGIGGPPPICGGLKAQAGQLQAQIGAMEGGGDDGRRAQLMAAWQRYGCDGGARAEQQRQRGVIYATPNDRPNIFERLFGDRTEVAVEPFPDRGMPGDEPDRDESDEPRRRRGGSLAVCVRTCDGFFFPVNFEGLSARDEHAEVCRSLCPAAETQVFYMSRGGAIEDAAMRDGTPYTSLPNARKYQESRDLSCICKHPGQTWASAMKGVTDLVEMRKGDIIVSPEQAAAMSRPKEAKAAPTTPKREAARKQLEARRGAADDAAVLPESALPTGGEASSGIGPRGQQRERFVGADAGVKTEVTRADGSRAVVRNVAPDLGGEALRSGSGEARRP